MRADTIPARAFAMAKSRPSDPAYYEKTGGSWKQTSWRGYASQIRQAGKALMALGLEPGGKVALLGFNRPEWVVFDMAAMAVGGAGAGVYTTCSAEEVQYIVDHSESLVVLLEDEGQWQKIASQRDNLPRLAHAVMMRGAPAIDDPLAMSWEEFLARGDEITDDAFEARVDALEPEALATLIYTSGTTGPPKGVMLSHDNLAWTASAMAKLVDFGPGDSALSYLPLSHIAEQTLTILGPATTGAAIYYAESIEKVADNLREVQPTLVFGVPRIWEKFHSGVSGKLSEATGFKKSLVGWVRGVCAEVSRLRNQSAPLPLPLKLKYKAANRLVISKLKPAIGLGNARVCVSGAAPIAKEILEFFASLDIIVHEVYGQSEDTGPTTFNMPGRTRFGTVGQPVPGVEVKIAEDGEILVKGRNVFLGYYKEEDATAECLVDGWLHSGDLGEFDADGFLTITGRKKDIIITAGGKNIAPKNIEAALKNTDLINEAVVIGDRRKFLTALITLDEEAVDKFLTGRVQNGDPAHEHPEVKRVVESAVESVNSHLARVETIKKFTILPRNFTVETGELTPTLKVKRKVVNENFTDEIESMYRD
jgi:long-chain acyl-CoA synthetase